MKIIDTLQPEGGSRAERWWEDQGFIQLYKYFRKGDMEKRFYDKLSDVRLVHEVFQLRGYQFGNWVTHEDRFNYLAALGICLYDLNRVLRFKGNNMGLDKTLGVAFGARGVKGALAHYEPATKIINLTRYYEESRYREPTAKKVRFVYSGGVGAFAHEYGHFLDYFFGAKVEIHPRIYALSDGRSTDPTRIAYDPKKHPMRNIMEEIMQKAYWDKSRRGDSTFVKRISRAVDGAMLEYFLRRNEIFARLFEQYIAYKLKEQNIQNIFLTQTKYNTLQYMTPTEFKEVVPLFDKLIVQMRKHF